MFGWGCLFRDRRQLQERWRTSGRASPLPLTQTQQVLATCDPLVALDNRAGAQPIYGFRPRPVQRLGLVVGNERQGVADDLLRAARYRLEIPMASRRVNTLNVAAAAAVGMYYLTQGSGGLHVAANPQRRRPDVLLLGAGEHVELGSAIRSAAAFGWQHLLIEDRRQVWFGVDRATRSQGRAAARRGKNAIRLVPVTSDRAYAYDEACLVTLRLGGVPLHRANLARGPRQLIVLPDERHVDLAAEDVSRLARRVRHVTIELPQASEPCPYRYRLPATIALAEVARQVGTRRGRGGRGSKPHCYDRVLHTLDHEAGELLALADLTPY